MYSFKMKNPAFLILCFSILISCDSSDNPSFNFEIHSGIFTSGGASVEFIGKYPNGYFNVIFDYNISGDSPREMGENYAIALQNAVSGIEQYYTRKIEENQRYSIIVARANVLKEYVYEDYKEEIEGFASQFNGGTVDERDGKLSLNEIYAYNTPALSVSEGCSAIAVYGSRTATGNTISAHLYDFNYSPPIRAVFTVKNGAKSVLWVSNALSIAGVQFGINDDGIFVGPLSSPTEVFSYPDIKNKTYRGEIRYALENFNTIESFADYIVNNNHIDPQFILLISDPNEAKILEYSEDGMCELRSDDSILNPGLHWGFDDAVAAVNAFMLYGNTDNFLYNPVWGDMSAYNRIRWNAYRTQLSQKGPIVTFDEVKEMASYYVDYEHYTYHQNTRQIIVFDASNFRLEIYPRNGRGFMLSPEFLEVPVSFD